MPSKSIAAFWLAIPLCCSPFPQLCGVPLLMVSSRCRNMRNQHFQVRPSSRVLQLPLVKSPQRFDSSHGLSCPSTLASCEDPLVRRGSNPTFGPPLGFGYPFDGLRPSQPGEPYFMLTASLDFAPSKFLLGRKVSSR